MNRKKKHTSETHLGVHTHVHPESIQLWGSGETCVGGAGCGNRGVVSTSGLRGPRLTDPPNGLHHRPPEIGLISATQEPDIQEDV